MQNKSTQEFDDIIRNIIENQKVQEMKKYKQHYETSTFDHCYMVSYYCYKVCKKLKLDYKSVAKAGMLHDFFLYDWRIKNGRKGLHAFTHGKTACKNASELFELSEKEKDMIIKHMWPVTPQFPRSKEGFILTFIDKYCALAEAIKVLKKNIHKKKVWRYAYIFLAMIVLKINKGNN